MEKPCISFLRGVSIVNKENKLIYIWIVISIFVVPLFSVLEGMQILKLLASLSDNYAIALER